VVEPYWKLDACGQADLVRGRGLAPRELVEAAIARIQELNPVVNAVIHERFEQALIEADKVALEKPFAGVPIVLKDLGAPMAGEPFELGSRALKGVRAGLSSYLVRSLQDAGFIVVGRTNSPEFGTNITTEPLNYGPTRNPWSLGHSSGGSSGGSAVAVATGMVPIAHGSDGGGSIRIPASCCGVVGLKPSRGRVSKGPSGGDGWAGSAIDGVLSRSVRDTAAGLDCIAGYRSGDPSVAPPFSRPLAKEVGVEPPLLRIGFLDHPVLSWSVPSDDCKRAVHNVASRLDAAGHFVAEAWPKALEEEEFQDHFVTVVKASTAGQLDNLSVLAGRKIEIDELEPDNQFFVNQGRKLSATDYVHAVDWLQGFGRRMMSFWTEEGYDLLLSPVIAQPPPPLGYLSDPVRGLDRQLEYLGYTGQFNVSGQPAISVPMGATSAAPWLPIGVQIVAAYAREDLLVQVASLLEAEFTSAVQPFPDL